jgi:hypothetical protein
MVVWVVGTDDFAADADTGGEIKEKTITVISMVRIIFVDILCLIIMFSS